MKRGEYVRVDPVLARRAARNIAQRAATVRAVCRRVADGETLEAICRDPMMPLRQDFNVWIAEEPEFARMMRDARGRSGQAKLARPGRPGRWSEALGREFLGRIADGRGLVEVCSEPDMPSHTTVYRWLRTKPDFAVAYAQARQEQADFLFDLAWTIARRAGDAAEIAAARLQIQTIKWRCARLTPTVYGTAAAARQARAGMGPEAGTDLADGERPVWVTVRRFARSPDDPSKVVEVIPERQEYTRMR